LVHMCILNELVKVYKGVNAKLFYLLFIEYSFSPQYVLRHC